jgi:tRNA threonylcarbamoyladenosine biosynthesis protein TsaE
MYHDRPMESWTTTCHNTTETSRLAGRVAALARPGQVIALNGELGAGKTQFVRAFSIALGVDAAAVNSPTFVLLQYYNADDLLIAHMDAYRLADLDEFLAIGGDEVLEDSETICLIEWADRVREILPSDHVSVHITHAGESARRFDISAAAGSGAALVKALSE